MVAGLLVLVEREFVDSPCIVGRGHVMVLQRPFCVEEHQTACLVQDDGDGDGRVETSVLCCISRNTGTNGIDKDPTYSPSSCSHDFRVKLINQQ